MKTREGKRLIGRENEGRMKWNLWRRREGRRERVGGEVSVCVGCRMGEMNCTVRGGKHEICSKE